MRTTTSPYIEVRKSNIHSTGVFAAVDIPKDTNVIEYVGAKITKVQAEKIAAKELETIYQ